ncbi:MAG: valine--tRNA ligase [Candidatus Omnitrophica bacterium]|jgi:valyl-tRNA synthetase|nr:valine--tRNA ligase [Candidatus Omnitrophota bacterium]
MQKELKSQYNPQSAEDKWYKLWEENKYFSAKTNKDKKPYAIVIPPPNVTGILHMGHALNNTIQDILIRYHRMKGFEALWMPGIDHAGIATQNVVEKSIAKEGLKRQDLGRDEFIKRVWKWKEEYGSTIIKQLKKLGASCDWDRLRFTMDAQYSETVIDVFVRLYEKGLIYRGSYIINWCPRCQTALADEEAPHQNINGHLYYIKYPLKEDNKQFVIVATTRPETMLGDTAVAVNPKDKRYKKLVGKTLILPLVNREIKVIADSMVDPKFGTGAVKVTPAHDPNDYATGKKHGLEFINVMHPDARMNENAGKYSNLDRFQARKMIIDDLTNLELIEKIDDYEVSAGHCYRCHTIIEPYLSKQWFVKTKPLAKPAIEAVKKGKIKFHPHRWTKVYLNWMENIQDWCISRQIWWGHRLPVYYCKNCQLSAVSYQPSAKNEKLKAESRKLKTEKGIIVSKIKPERCPDCAGTDIYQDEDVLDTWFSSWLWPFATFGWPNQLKAESRKLKTDLDYFYPTSVLVTAPEIIFFWVARMIMAGFEFMQDIPFKDVYIHGTVRDIEGKKMSKSLGNIIDPLEIIGEYGTDALRFSLISITAQGQDVFLSKERFEQGRNFANKIWNASRFILINLNEENTKHDLCAFFKKEHLELIDRWILSRLYITITETEKALNKFKFNEAANLLYSFFWHEFCDWYLEAIKPEIKDPQHQLVMYKVLEKFLRALHPFMPFISEELYSILGEKESIMNSSYPHIQKDIIDHKQERKMQLVFEIITQIRNLRSQINIRPDQKVKAGVFAHSQNNTKLIMENTGLIKYLSRSEEIEILGSKEKPSGTISAIAEDVDIYLYFAGLLDVEKEKLRIKEKQEQLIKSKQGKESRLGNKDFLKNAPADIIEKETEGLSKIASELDRLDKMYRDLK